MMYPFLQLENNTEIVHSEMKEDGSVKVYVEQPDGKDGFHNAYCILPEYRWEEVNGFSPDEIDRYQEIIQSVAHLIMEFSRQGGFENASGF